MFKLFSSKKAMAGTELTLTTIISIVVSLTVLIMLIVFVNNVQGTTIYERRFLSMDVALFIDALYAAQGNIEVIYPKDTLWFSYNFAPGRVEVSYPQDILSLKEEGYTFIPDSNMQIDEIKISPVYNDKKLLEKKAQFKFLKLPDKIKVKEGNIIEGTLLKTLDCPELESAESIQGKTSYVPPIVDRPPFEEERFKKTVKESFVAVISYKGSHPDQNTNDIVAYISDKKNIKESKRVACLILNKIISDEKLNSIIQQKSLTPITGISIALTDSFEILNQGNKYIALLLKIGNKNIEKEKNILEDEEANHAVMEAISRGKEEYD